MSAKSWSDLEKALVGILTTLLLGGVASGLMLWKSALTRDEVRVLMDDSHTPINKSLDNLTQSVRELTQLVTDVRMQLNFRKGTVDGELKRISERLSEIGRSLRIIAEPRLHPIPDQIDDTTG